jgi:hypothetical protein
VHKFVHRLHQGSEAIGFGKDDVNARGRCQIFSHVLAEHSEQDDFGVGKLSFQYGGYFDSV